MGRATKLNDPITDSSGRSATRFEIAVRALQSGQTRRVAAMLAGIATSTFFMLLSKGERGQGQYRDFREAVTRAQALAVIRIVNAVYRCVKGAVFELPSYDETGTRILDEKTGKPKVRLVIVPPDGKLGLQLLAQCNPTKWGPRAAPDMVTGLSEQSQGKPVVADLLAATIKALRSENL